MDFLQIYLPSWPFGYPQPCLSIDLTIGWVKQEIEAKHFGYHASSSSTPYKLYKICKWYNISVGSKSSFHCLENAGRVELKVSEAFTRSVVNLLRFRSASAQWVIRSHRAFRTVLSAFGIVLCLPNGGHCRSIERSNQSVLSRFNFHARIGVLKIVLLLSSRILRGH